jgi:hypothetical protein
MKVGPITLFVVILGVLHLIHTVLVRLGLLPGITLP